MTEISTCGRSLAQSGPLLAAAGNVQFLTRIGVVHYLMSNYFVTNWLPNIVCGLIFGAGGCLLSWWIGFRQSKIAQRTQATLLHLAAHREGHTVNLDERGESLGTLDRPIGRPRRDLSI